MNDRTRIAGYLAGLVAVFAVSWTVGNMVGGDEPPSPTTPGQHMQH